MNILANPELVCVLAMIFVLISIPLTGVLAMLFGVVAIMLIFWLLLVFITEDSGDSW